MPRYNNRRSGTSKRNILKQSQKGVLIPTRFGADYGSTEWQKKAEEESANLRDAFLSLLSRSNSIITGNEIKCQLSDAVEIAATDGTTVYFNSNLLMEIFKTAVVKSGHFVSSQFFGELIEMRGLNFHEISHCLWTPRAGTKFIKDIHKMNDDRQKYLYDNSLPRSGVNWHYKCFNILEDQRIESLFVATYPASAPYLRKTVTKFLLEDAGTNQAVWVLLYGRRYLSPAIRKTAVALFKSIVTKDGSHPTDAQISSLSGLIDAYRALILTRKEDQAQALIIISDFTTLFLAIVEDANGGTAPAGNGSGSGAMPSDEEVQHGQPSTTAETKKAQEKREAQDADADADDDGDDSDGDSDEGSEDGSEDSDEDSDDSGDSNGSDSDDSDDSDDEEDSEESEDNGSGNLGASDKESSERKSLTDEIKKACDRSDDIDSKNLEKEMVKVIKQVRTSAQKETYKRFFDEVVNTHSQAPATAEDRILSNTISSALAKFKADKDSQWDSEENIGKLNVMDKISARGLHTNFFDQWVDEGDERPDAEVVILLDKSGSMNNRSTDFNQFNADFLAEKANPPAGGCKVTKYDFKYNSGDTTIRQASVAMWAIKVACQKHDIPCTVIGFSDTPHAIYVANKKVSTGTIPLHNGDNGTYPLSALLIAADVLKKSDAKYKLCVTITDGEFSGDVLGATDAVKDMNDRGYFTLLIGLSNGVVYDSATGLLSPKYPAGLDQETRTGKYNSRGTVDYVAIAPGYGNKKVLLAETSQVLAKQIAKVLLQGVVANR